MNTDEGWQRTECAGLEICLKGDEVRGLRLLGWEAALPRSLAVVLGVLPAMAPHHPAARSPGGAFAQSARSIA
ncbi:hypothetical protein AB0N09_17315 [Streptomyces erythrochromogenes]|uniref:hypothetical protein n=1 Tax=Streptomyces erythrochromogenes TaxID=285574 RepID=UPI0034433C8E